MSLKSKQQGFTIVELLIVIVVIGILAALVITTFTGIQQRARNTERETDIKAIHGQVEAYFAQNGRYPTLANLNDDAWRAADNLKGLDEDALHSPNETTDVAAAPSATQYGYAVTPAGCDNDTTTATADCSGYTLTANLEGGTTFVKTALN
jgi:prepilin-type N-terminal cleavage/methylation domain-containing protein